MSLEEQIGSLPRAEILGQLAGDRLPRRCIAGRIILALLSEPQPVQHVHLRDSTKQKLHVRVGQGEIDYGKLITQLSKVGYDRALSVQNC